jgi:dipeptidyl aminopeptidase/acylaminoacyl peptidase
VALHLAASDARVSAVVAVASFSSVRRVVSDYEHRYFPTLEPWVPEAWLDDALADASDSARFDPENTPMRAASRLNGDLLLIHGLADTQVPPEHAQALRAAAGAEAKLVLLEGEDHASVLRDETGLVTRAVLAFFAGDDRGSTPLGHAGSGERVRSQQIMGEK